MIVFPSLAGYGKFKDVFTFSWRVYQIVYFPSLFLFSRHSAHRCLFYLRLVLVIDHIFSFNNLYYSVHSHISLLSQSTLSFQT
jgi:hypothetical protein